MRTARFSGSVGCSILRNHTHPCGPTDTCENITLPQTSFAGRNKENSIVLFSV